MKTTERTTLKTSGTEQVNKLLSKLIKAQEKGDTEAFANFFAHDQNMVNIGTDLDEIWYDWPSFYNWMRQMLRDNKGIHISAKDTRVTLSKNGDVAWYSQLIDTCLETKGEPTSIEGFRHTGVMEKRNSKWLIVQSHMSAPQHT